MDQVPGSLLIARIPVARAVVKPPLSLEIASGGAGADSDAPERFYAIRVKSVTPLRNHNVIRHNIGWLHMRARRADISTKDSNPRAAEDDGKTVA